MNDSHGDDVISQPTAIMDGVHRIVYLLCTVCSGFCHPGSLIVLSQLLIRI